MENSTIFDDVLRTIQERLPKLLIPLVNEVFQTGYSMDEEVTRLPEEYQKLLSKVIADSCNRIGDRVYHFECQSKKDGSMILRMVEYDFMIALSDSIRQKKKTELNFPRSCIIYLRSTENTLFEEQMKITFADDQQVTYKVPVLKLKKYGIDEIFEKNLLILLPYYIINYERDLKKIAASEEKTEQLMTEYQRIIKRLEFVTQSDTDRIFEDIIKMMQRVIDYLLRKEADLKERLGDVMGGKILPLPSDELREARAAGKAEGKAEGIQALIHICKEFEITKDKIMKRLMLEFSLSEQQAKEALLKYWE